MSPYDNEIYRGPPEPGPTLAQDIRSYGTDIYIVTPPQTTAQQDVPATEEPARQDSKPVKKKKSRIAKAMKLLASCTAAVVVATALTAPVTPAPPPQPTELPVWSSFGPVHGEGQYSFSVPAQKGGAVQVSIGGKSYRLTAQQEDLYLQWHETYDPSEDGSHGGFYVCMENPAEDWSMMLDFNVNSIQKMEDSEGLGEIQTATGETLYVRSFYIGSSWGLPTAQQVIDDLGAYIQISDTAYDGWGNVFIGETMYSETNSQWNGIQAVISRQENGEFWFQRICYTGEAAYSTDDLICRHRVNGIDWSFYFSMEKGETMIWAVPEQENIAFGHNVDSLLDAYGLDPAVLEEMYGSAALAEIQGELAVKLRAELLNIIEVYTVGCGLQYYHLVEQYSENVMTGTLPEWPRVGTWNTSRDDQEYSIQPASVNSRSCLVSVGGEVFQIESLWDDVYIFCDQIRSYAIHVDNPYYAVSGSVVQDDYHQFSDFVLNLQNTAKNRHIRLRISLYPLVYEDGSVPSACSAIQTDSGRTLYITAASFDGTPFGLEYWALLAATTSDIFSYFRITEVQDLGREWGKVQLGDSLISDINAQWNGLRTVKHMECNPDSRGDFNWGIYRIRYTDSLDMQYYSHIGDREINGIQWSFYFKDRGKTAAFPEAQYYYSSLDLCAVPSQGDFCLELDTSSLLFSLSGYTEYEQLIEDPMTYEVLIYDVIDIVMEEGLQYIYPLGMQSSENKPAPGVTTPTDQPETEPTTEATTEATEVPLTTEVETYEFTYPDNPEITETGTEIRYYDRNGELVKSEFHTYRNDQLCRQGLSDEQNQVYTIELFEYHENGALRDYWVYYFENASKLQSFEYFEAYNEEYDEGGTVIDTDHCIYDSERDLWVVEDYEKTEWGVYADGLFSFGEPSDETQLYEGVLQLMYSVQFEFQRNADGSGTEVIYDSDGSLISTKVITVDEEANTWTETIYHHRRDSDNYPYRNEYQVEFDDNGNVIRYSFRQDDEGEGFWTIDSEVRFGDLYEVEYDDAGNRIEYYYTEEGYVPESWMFCFDEWGRVKSFDGVYQD